jgi:hypothetical protein
MRLDTKPHPLYCGLDLHARTLSGCILSQDGEVVLHRNMPASPDAVLKALAPYRDHIGIAVACLLTWYWLADLGAQEGLPCVLGHALSMHAIHGGTAQHDTSDAQQIAVLLRGGMLPQASEAHTGGTAGAHPADAPPGHAARERADAGLQGPAGRWGGTVPCARRPEERRGRPRPE